MDSNAGRIMDEIMIAAQGRPFGNSPMPLRQRTMTLQSSFKKPRIRRRSTEVGMM